MRYVEMPTAAELDLLRRWRARFARGIRIAWALWSLGVVALVVWGATSATWTSLLAGQSEPVLVEVMGTTKTGACGTRLPSPKYRAEVRVIDPGRSHQARGDTGHLDVCGAVASGDRREVSALRSGAFTAWTPTGAYVATVSLVLVAAALAALIWLVRRDGRRIDRVVAEPPGYRKLEVEVMPRTTGWVAASIGPAPVALRLGPPLITTDGQLRRWRFRRVPRPEPPLVTLVLLGPPGMGHPALVVDAQGMRHWRTVGPSRGPRSSRHTRGPTSTTL